MYNTIGSFNDLLWPKGPLFKSTRICENNRGKEFVWHCGADAGFVGLNLLHMLVNIKAAGKLWLDGMGDKSNARFIRRHCEVTKRVVDSFLPNSLLARTIKLYKCFMMRLNNTTKSSNLKFSNSFIIDTLLWYTCRSKADNGARPGPVHNFVFVMKQISRFLAKTLRK